MIKIIKRQCELEEEISKDIFIKICEDNKVVTSNWINMSNIKKDPPDYYVEIL